MAAFSYQQHQVPLSLDSVFLPNNATHTPIKNISNTTNMSGFIDEAAAAAAGNFINNTYCFSQFFQPETFPLDVRFHESSSRLDHSSSKVAALSDNETSVTKKQSTESSTVVDNKLESGEQVTQKVTGTPPMDRKRRNSNGSSNSAQSKDHGREGKGKKQKKCSGNMKEEEKPKVAAEKKVPEEPPTGYIHVRARRGQATDSHSLAERVRREKISERMKILQRLVPGCDKVTGKALMLDEIINYVQSLQNQVEFLSMKLASVNPLFYDFGMDNDAFMIRPERLSSMSSPPLPSLQQCSPIQPTAFADATTTATGTATSTTPTTTTFAAANNYPLIDSSVLLHGMRPAEFTTQDCGSLMWDVEEQRQKLLNPSGFTNNLCSFH